MDSTEAKINQLVVENQAKTGSWVRLFTARPPKKTAEKIGKIFGLIEIEDNNPKIPELIDVIIEEIKNNYYQDFSDEENLIDISQHFESALKKTNLAIASFLENKQLNLNLEKVNIIIALSRLQDLHFTLVGNLGAILFYNLSRNNYRIISILENGEPTTGEPDPIKLFSQIITGRIKKNDVLFITTSNLLDYFSLERIKNILTENVLAEGLAEMEKLIIATESKENFAVLTMELKKTASLAKKLTPLTEFNYRQAASRDSIKGLIQAEKETQKLLTPSILPEIKKYTNSLKQALANYLEKTKSTTSNIYEKQKSIIKKSRPVLKSKFKAEDQIEKSRKIKNKLILLSSTIKKIIINIIEQPIWQKIARIGQKIFSPLILKFKKLPPASRILLIISLILAIIFLYSMFWIGYKNQKEEKIKTVDNIIIEVENKKNEAESSLIYRSENQARQLLVEAKNLLTSLEPALKTQKEQIINLDKEIENKLDELRHFIKIDNPIQIINFQNLDSQAKIANLMISNQKHLYTQNINNKSIYKANIDNQALAAVFLPNIDVGNLKLGLKISDNELIFFNDSLSAFSFNAQNENIKNLTINISDKANIVDLKTYNNRLYLLDSANSQIYRYDKTANGYGGVRNWLQENLDLSQASSLAIDGSIYILKKNGEILKFQRGRLTDFETGIIDPALNSAAKIKTTEDSSFLYILEPAAKRLVVLNKEGNLINQYTSEKFDDLKDFVVIEEDKKIYVLNGNSIFAIPAEHLE